MPVTLVPFFWPDRFLLLLPVAELVALGQRILQEGAGHRPLVRAELAVRIRRIDDADVERSMLSWRAALSIIGSIAGTSWFSPGPRWAPAQRRVGQHRNGAETHRCRLIDHDSACARGSRKSPAVACPVRFPERCKGRRPASCHWARSPSCMALECGTGAADAVFLMREMRCITGR